MLVEFRLRVPGVSRAFINPDHVVAVYVRGDGCFIVTREQVEQGRSVQLLVDEPVARVLAKLGCEISTVPPSQPPRRATPESRTLPATQEPADATNAG